MKKRKKENFTGKIICWYRDKADGIKVSSIGSKPMAAEVSGLDEKTAISANFTITPEKIEKLKNYLIACSWHAFTNSEIYYFFLRFFLVCFLLKALQSVIFCEKIVMVTFSYLNRRILPCFKIKSEKRCEKITKFVDSEFMKTCHEHNISYKIFPKNLINLEILTRLQKHFRSSRSWCQSGQKGHFCFVNVKSFQVIHRSGVDQICQLIVLTGQRLDNVS